MNEPSNKEVVSGITKSDLPVSIESGQSLYSKHEKVYPREVHGLFAALRVTGVFVLLGLYYIIPWLEWEGTQLVLFDLPNRKFHIFGIIFWPQDFFYLALLLIIAALSLFFFTALAGRLWCGYACPQTVWTEVFLWIERKVEGDRPRQMKLDKAPWTFDKLKIKATKHFIWVIFSLYTGLTFVGYFSPLRELAANAYSLNLGPWEWFWIIFYSVATYGNAGWLREQVCTYMCPYARFQSAMIDSDTLIISYDTARGESRGKRKKGEDPKNQGLGDCIDCTICVQVCPTGIDIRDGLQYDCIGCAACIDACDDVMEKVGYEKGLIRYTTENILNGSTAHFIRPRIVVYGIILLVIIVSTFYAISQREPLAMDVLRDRNSLYRETNEGWIENVYIIKVMNMENITRRYHLTVSGIEGLTIDMDRPEVEVPAGSVIEIPVRAKVNPDNLDKPSSAIQFKLQADHQQDLNISEEARFIGPR
ncbi:MAG: cytochrome c oxidase accessory protein CcoG [Gammaproteobacteria bacterium]|nr:cytochrome c oxidase accessory protein CcoG [Gammaproteobacteria bacterium]